MKEKIKVVWLCHFSNIEIQSIIKPQKSVNEIAPWIPKSYNIFKNDSKVELYIISPHEYIKGIKSFVKDNITFYFYNAHIPLIGRHWPGFFKWDYISDFRKNKRVTRRIVSKIKPDIIHLHGAENAYYSSTFIQFLGVSPTILTLQGFVSKSSNKNSYQIKRRIAIEKEIISGIKDAFFRTGTMLEDMKSINPDLNFYWNDYPFDEIKPFTKIPKKFDLVFFARITKDKGIEDLLHAASLLKRGRPNIKLCVIGSGKLEPFKILAKELGIEENVIWAGFLPSQSDVHRLASQAKISVLPTYHDMISGTIIESMFLKLPVVAYDVGSIHEVNERETVLSLVNKLDVEGLAKAIENLLDNPALREERAEKGYIRAFEMFVHPDEEIREGLLNAYYKVIEDFHKK